jgi:hypothetical protein
MRSHSVRARSSFLQASLKGSKLIGKLIASYTLAHGLGPQALFHASPLAGIQRHRGGIRQNLQTRLCSAIDLAGC